MRSRRLLPVSQLSGGRSGRAAEDCRKLDVLTKSPARGARAACVSSCLTSAGAETVHDDSLCFVQRIIALQAAWVCLSGHAQ